MRRLVVAVFFLASTQVALSSDRAAQTLKVGSKKFTESVVLAELLSGIAADSGSQTAHVRELGGTRLLWKALLGGEIDARRC